MKIDELKKAINGVLGENRKMRREAIISLDKSYVSWRTHSWTDDVWDAYIAGLEKNPELHLELNGNTLIVFRKSRRDGASE